MKKRVTLLISCITISMAILSQTSHTLTINGKINNKTSNDPIPASVRIKNTSKGIAADSKGVFHIAVESLPVTLLITAIGFEDQEISVANEKEIIVNMEPSYSIINEVILQSKNIPTKLI